jgi:hypothetical protein
MDMIRLAPHKYLDVTGMKTAFSNIKKKNRVNPYPWNTSGVIRCLGGEGFRCHAKQYKLYI